jgi:hypothetical protein
MAGDVYDVKNERFMAQVSEGQAVGRRERCAVYVENGEV